MNALLLAAALFAQTPAPAPAPLPTHTHIRAIEIVIFPKEGKVESVAVGVPLEDGATPLTPAMIDQVAKLVVRLMSDLGGLR